MSDEFFEKPILNSPYERPSKHWELDEAGQPTLSVSESCRPVALIASKSARKLPSGESVDIPAESVLSGTASPMHQDDRVPRREFVVAYTRGRSCWD